MEPSAQASQVSVPVLDVNEPLAQDVHDDAPAALYLPATHDTQDACPVEPWNEPAYTGCMTTHR